MATSKIQIDEGTGKNLPTYSISEDAVTKELSRTVLNTSAGVEVAPLTDTQLRASAVPVSGTVTANLSATDNAVLDAIQVGTDKLPADPAREGGNLASIKTNTDKIPALGQALATGSVPVVLTASQLTTLTPPAAISGFATSAKQDTLDASVNTLLKPASTLAKVTTVDTITNVVHIDDNGGSVTVDGTVTATLATETTKVIGTVNDKIADGDHVAFGAKADAKSTATDTTSVSAMSVLKEISYMEQNPASRAVTNAGTFPVQSTDSIVSATGLTLKGAFIASQTGATVLTPTSGKKVVITDIIISATGAGTVYLFDSTDSATTCIGPTLSFAANGGATMNLKKPFVSAAANNVIKYTSGAGSAGSIWIQYYEI